MYRNLYSILKCRLVPKVIFFRKSQVKSPKSQVMTLTWLDFMTCGTSLVSTIKNEKRFLKFLSFELGCFFFSRGTSKMAPRNPRLTISESRDNALIYCTKYDPVYLACITTLFKLMEQTMVKTPWDFRIFIYRTVSKPYRTVTYRYD